MCSNVYDDFIDHEVCLFIKNAKSQYHFFFNQKNTHTLHMKGHNMAKNISLEEAVFKFHAKN